MRISDWSSDVCSSDLAAIDIDLERYDKTWDVNVRGPLVWTQLAWKAAMAEHGGSVVNIASIGGLSVEPGIGIYNGTKAALIHLTKTLAAERSEEHTSELQSLMRTSYAVFGLKKNKHRQSK